MDSNLSGEAALVSGGAQSTGDTCTLRSRRNTDVERRGRVCRFAMNFAVVVSGGRLYRHAAEREPLPFYGGPSTRRERLPIPLGTHSRTESKRRRDYFDFATKMEQPSSLCRGEAKKSHCS